MNCISIASFSDSWDKTIVELSSACNCSILEDGILHLSESAVAPLFSYPRTPSVHSETWGVCVRRSPIMLIKNL